MTQIRNIGMLSVRVFRGIAKFLPFCLFGFLLFTSCSETTDEVEEFVDWQNKNTTYWNNLYTTTQQKIAGGDTDWKIIRNWSLENTVETENTSYIIVHVLNTGEGTVSPLFTDSAHVYYTGRLLGSTSYPDGYVFTTTNNTTTTGSGSANSKSTMLPKLEHVGNSTQGSGFSTALQNMHVGDEWEVYVPWPLGGGTTSSTAIPAYSVLVYSMRLAAFYRPGYDIPEAKAKPYTPMAVE